MKLYVGDGVLDVPEGPRAIPHNSKCRYGERGAADAVPQLPERCLSRKAGIVRCCPRNEILLRDIWQGFGTVKTVPYG